MKHSTLTLSLSLLALAISGTALATPKTLTFCMEASPSGFNPQLVSDGPSVDASGQQIYNRLTTFVPGKTEIIPSLAESWDISADGKEYTFHLRKGVKFHSNKDFKPSREFNADDVLYSFNRQLDPNHPYHNVSNGTYEYFSSMDLPNLIEKIEKVDDHTVKFVLKTPNSPFLANIALEFASILSAEYAEQMLKAGTPEKVDTNPIGTGPFVFVDYKKDAVIRYKAFDDYWQGRTPLDRLVFAITPEASVRAAKLQQGECQVMTSPNPADIDTLKQNPNVNLLSHAGMNIGYLHFNVQKKPFDNIKVRQALNYAVNKEAIVKSVYQGAGKVAKNAIPPTIWGYNDAIQDYTYDPEKAKALLKEAGIENGFETEIWAMPVSRPYNPNARRMAEMIQEDWKAVGVNAKIVSYEWGEYLNRMRVGDDPTGMMGWNGDNGDPDNFLNNLLSCASAKQGSNYSKWCYKPFDDLIIKASQISNKSERSKLYEQAQAIFKEQAPWITIAHSTVYEPIRKEVKNYVLSPLNRHSFYGVDLE